MSVQLADIIDLLDTAYPPRLAQDWDSVGLVCGDPAETVETVTVAVDATAAVVAEVPEGGLLLAHHPLLLRGVDTVAAEAGARGLDGAEQDRSVDAAASAARVAVEREVREHVERLWALGAELAELVRESGDFLFESDGHCGCDPCGGVCASVRLQMVAERT